jgi:hypothetical protein
VSPYAEGTKVASEQSRADIERTLRKHGATGFVYATNDETGMAIVGFILFKRQVRFALPLPKVTEDRFRLTPARRTLRSKDEQVKAWEQECRRQWRSLALVIKAKLAAVDDGIVEFEREFLAHLVVPGGGTVYDHIAPNLAASLESGRAEDLMPHAITGGQS